MKRLDGLVPDGKIIEVMKIDVEGHELNVFKGSQRLLSERRILNIIFEDHLEYPSPVVQLLSEYGYTIFRLEKGWFSVQLKDPLSPTSISSYEPRNFLATLKQDSVIKRVKGYKCLFN